MKKLFFICSMIIVSLSINAGKYYNAPCAEGYGPIDEAKTTSQLLSFIEDSEENSIKVLVREEFLIQAGERRSHHNGLTIMKCSDNHCALNVEEGLYGVSSVERIRGSIVIAIGNPNSERQINTFMSFKSNLESYYKDLAQLGVKLTFCAPMDTLSN